jgi:hypothetical protein
MTLTFAVVGACEVVTGLVLWPLFAGRRGASGNADVPWALRPGTCARVAATLAALTVWYAAEQATRGPMMGLAERTARIAQTLWPLVVVLWCRRSTAEAGDFDFGPDGCEPSPG